MDIFNLKARSLKWPDLGYQLMTMDDETIRPVKNPFRISQDWSEGIFWTKPDLPERRTCENR